MHVKAVADDFRRDFIGRQHRAGEAGHAVIERRHPVEQVRRLLRTSGNGRTGLVVARRGMSQRHAMTARHQPADQIEAAIELRRQRHDADVRRRPLDFAQDVASREIARRVSAALARGL